MPPVNALPPFALTLALLSCQASTREDPAPGTAAAVETKPAPTAETRTETRTETKATPATPAKAEPKLARVREDVPLPLSRLLGHTVADVQAQLGPPLGKGMARETCVRFVPERVFFTCKYAIQRYEDKTGTFTGVRVTFEDGVAAAVGFDGWKAGTGTFTPEALLTAIGLELPEPGKLEQPGPDVRLWTWFNHVARLRIGGKQYRVELSIVGEDWIRSRVEVILNDPLTEAQKAAIIPPRDAPAVVPDPPPGG